MIKFFVQNCVFIPLVGPYEAEKSQHLQLAQNWNYSINVWQKLLFYQHSQPLFDVMRKQIENTDFVQGVDFEFIVSLKNNGTKHLSLFDMICTSNALVDIATAGRHRVLSTFSIKRDLFHQRKLGRDAELQNTNSLFFKSPRVSTDCDARQYA